MEGSEVTLQGTQITEILAVAARATFITSVRNVMPVFMTSIGVRAFINFNCYLYLFISLFMEYSFMYVFMYISFFPSNIRPWIEV